MSQSQGILQNLNNGSQESLRALIQALVPEASANPSGKYSGDVVEKITEKLSQLVGPGVQQEYKENRNEGGELVDEEGLPIIDINEPVDIAAKLHSAGSIPVESLLPLATLPPSARDRLRERRNRILDLLEQEEENSQQQKSDYAEEEAAKERERRKEAKELQKKMGRALLQNMGKEKQKEEQEREAQRLLDEESDKRRSPSTKKKTVAFVEASDKVTKDNEASSSKIDWGDVTPAKLQTTKKPTLLSQSLLDQHPMKMSVVERVPGGKPTVLKPSTPRQFPTRLIDSDDDSDLDESETTNDSDADEEATLQEDSVDLDFAQHQREIALEYYKKRNTIGQTAAAAMMNHTHSPDEHLDANSDLIQDSTKPEISQFKANRIASAYNASIPTSGPSTTSLAGSVLPASSTRTIQRAIRTGKIDDNGKLVGGEDDSASEHEDEGLQEVLNLLRKGEVYNIGPDGNYAHALLPNPNVIGGNAPSTSSPLDPAAPPQDDTAQYNTASAPNLRPKTSRFKASRSAAGRPLASSSSIVTSLLPSTLSDSLSPSVTPVSHVGRSSPKMPADAPSPVSSVVAERVSSIKSPSPSKVPPQAPSPFSMIVDSPSFSVPQGSHTQPGIPGMIVSSPSFPSPPSSNSRRSDRPPTLFSASLVESRPGSQGANQNVSSMDRPEKKVSRFRAERAQ